MKTINDIPDRPENPTLRVTCRTCGLDVSIDKANEAAVMVQAIGKVHALIAPTCPYSWHENNAYGPTYRTWLMAGLEKVLSSKSLAGVELTPGGNA